MRRSKTTADCNEDKGEKEGRRSDYVITVVVREADWSNEVGDWHAIVESQQRDVFIEVAVAELLGDRAQHESGLGTHAVIASIMFTERHFDHEPHESFDAMRGCVKRDCDYRTCTN